MPFQADPNTRANSQILQKQTGSGIHVGGYSSKLMRLIEANHGERRSGGGEFGFMVHGGGRCKQHAMRGKANLNGEGRTDQTDGGTGCCANVVVVLGGGGGY
jgi:hypothetical protein